MNKAFLLFVFSFFLNVATYSNTQIISKLKTQIIEISLHPFLNSPELHEFASSISNKGNTTDLSLRELYWNTYQEDADLDEIVSSQQPDGSWKDIDYNDQARSNWQPTNHVIRLLYLSRAYVSPRSKFYKQKNVSEVLHRGLKFWFDLNPVCTNWWYNEIGIPRFIGYVFIFLENELSETEKQSAIKVMNKSGFRMTGQNKVWLAGNVLIKALLTNDLKLVKKARNVIASEIFITTQEGIQPDYSFHQHGPQQQLGNYGLSFISAMSYYANIFGGTSLSFNKKQIEILRNYVLDGENWVVWRGYFDVSACNRQLFKQAQIGKALNLSVAVYQLMQADTLNIVAYSNILNRNLVFNNALETLQGKHFWRSDLSIFRSPNHYTSVRACSPRVKGTEFTNNENKKGHFISDGCTIFLRTGDEYIDIFPIWDWNRLPGVTAPILDSIVRNPNDNYKNPHPFVGGLNHKGNGISTFHLFRNELNAKKTWFYLNGIFVSLGTEIKTTNGREIVTGINQTFQRGVTVCKNEDNTYFTTNDTILKTNELKYVWHDSTGYYFPEKSAITLSLQTQTGNWHEIADPYESDLISGKVFKLWINHGINSKLSDSYQYFVLQDISEVDLQQFSKKPTIEVLENNSIIQAVKTTNNELFQIAFHEPSKISTFSTSNYIESKTPGLLMVERINPRKVFITVADPTQLQKVFRCSISGKYVGNFSKYNRIKNETELNIPLPKNGFAGENIGFELTKN